MTYSEFLDRLRPEQGWELRPSGAIHHDALCPWLLVMWPEIHRGNGDIRVLVDSVDRRQSIWEAADNMRGHDPAIRRDLLLACGLKPEEAMDE